MATTTPPPPPPPISPPHEQEVDNHNHNHNHNQQPPITTCSPPQSSIPSPIEYADHQLTNSISPSSPPQLPDHQQPPPPEDIEHQQEPPVPPSPPPEQNSDHQQPLSPPPTATEQPPQNFIPENPVEIPDHLHTNPNPTSEHESTLSKQPPSSKPDDPIESPNLHQNPNPNLDHEFPSPSFPAKLQINPEPNQSPQETTLTPPLGLPILHVATVSPPPNKPQISPWTHQETANLIQAYQEKWYSLKKGPLKAGQWEEVAITVAARCGYDEPTKTSKQCRHKLEKLRKRYRAERGKSRSKANAWNFFKLMDNLEKGPLPISSSQPQSMALVEYQKPSNSNSKKRKNNDDDDDDDYNDDDNDDGDADFFVNKKSSSSRGNKNYTHHVPNGYLTRDLRFVDGGSRVVRGLRTPVVHKHKGFYKEDQDEEEEEEEEEEGGDDVSVAAQLAVEIKGFADKFVKMENKKIEMIRDVERYRLEMENKRMEMILESQQMLVETVNNAFSGSHKLSAN